MSIAKWNARSARIVCFHFSKIEILCDLHLRWIFIGKNKCFVEKRFVEKVVLLNKVYIKLESFAFGIGSSFYFYSSLLIKFVVFANILRVLYCSKLILVFLPFEGSFLNFSCSHNVLMRNFDILRWYSSLSSMKNWNFVHNFFKRNFTS